MMRTRPTVVAGANISLQQQLENEIQKNVLLESSIADVSREFREIVKQEEQLQTRNEELQRE